MPRNWGVNFMRRLLPLIGALLLLARTGAANACLRVGLPPPDEEMFAKASAVFIAHVFRVEETGTTRVLAEQAMEMLEERKSGLSGPEEAAARTRIESEPPVPLVEASFRVVEVLKGHPPGDGKVRSLPIVMCSGAVVA